MSKPKVAWIRSADLDFWSDSAEMSLTTDSIDLVDHDLEVHMVSSEGEIIEAVRDADLVLDEMVPLGKSVIQHMNKAQAIISLGHGFNHIEEQAATDMGIMVANCAGFCSDEVANHTIMFLLACSKRLIQLDKLVKNGEWTSTTIKSLFPMPAVYGQTLGLVGFGNIGRHVSRKAKAFGINVKVYDPYLEPWVAQEYEIQRVESLESLGAESDYVSMHVPLNSDTKGLADASLFKSMKPTAYFINTCRGPTQNESDLISALNNKEIAGAALDVFEIEPTPESNPLLLMDNVIASPHSAGTSDNSSRDGRIRLGEEAARVLKGMYPMSLVNPAVRTKIPLRNPAEALYV